MNNIENGWLDSLVKLYEKELLLNKGIFKGSKKEQLKNQLDVLENARIQVMKTKDKNLENLYKEFYYDLYIIKEDNIPYSVYESEVRLARERGYGDIPITKEYIKEKNKTIINDQKESLDKWLEYFLYDDEAKNYKSWEVFWVLEGIQKLGKYDKENHKYTKRDKNTIYSYPEINKQAIFNTLNLMEEYIKDKKGPNELKSALGQANFKQLYEYSLEQLMVQGDKKDYGNEGIWIKYNQGSDYHKLRDSLQGYKTGWCTAAGESFAKDQLENGDFYIYYSIDKNGEYKIPRIAIRMEGTNQIGEIRGIKDDQNIEPKMLPILDKKLQEFPDKDKYLKKEKDMTKLTEIDNKVQNNLELSIDELKFLYEIDSKIEGFGWKKDPRIIRIQLARYKVNDYAKIFGCKEDEIAFNQKEWENNFKKCKIFIGSLKLNSLTSAEGLVLPQYIEEHLDLSGLTSAEGLILPKNIGGSLELNSLTSAQGLTLPDNINVDLDLRSLTSSKGLVLPQSVGRNLDLRNLTNSKGLVLPKNIGRSLYLSNLTSAEGLILPKNIGGSLELNSLASTKGLVLPKSIGGYLDLRSLTSVEDLILPKNIGRSLYLSNLTSAEGLVLPKSIGSVLYLSSLTSIKGLILPENLTYTIRMKDFEITPENVDEYRNNKKGIKK